MTKKESRQERLTELEGKIAKHRANVAEGERELKRLEHGFRRAAEAQAAEIRNITDTVADLSAKGVVDKILTAKDIGGLTQLRENIGKMKQFIVIEKAALVRATKEKDLILAEIESEEADRLTAAVCEKIKLFIAKYRELEPIFLELFDLAAAARERDSRYFNRVPNLGFSNVFMVILDSVLKIENKAFMNPIGLLERIADIRGYGEPLIDRNPTWQDKPLVRDSFYQKSITIQ